LRQETRQCEEWGREFRRWKVGAGNQPLQRPDHPRDRIIESFRVDEHEHRSRHESDPQHGYRGEQDHGGRHQDLGERGREARAEGRPDRGEKEAACERIDIHPHDINADLQGDWTW